MSLIVTGTIGIDTVYTPTTHVEKVLGGSCTYFAAAASFYGPVRMVAAVGGDWPAAHKATLGKFKNIDATGLEVRPGSKTFAWGGKYLQNMNSRETLFTELGVLVEDPPRVPENFKDSQFVFLANTHPAVQLGLLSHFPKRRLAVADTMDLWINTARADLEKLLKQVDGLVLNYDECELLTGKANPVTGARHILEMGPSFVVVKKGEHGCLIVHKDGIGALPAYPAETVTDPTGAGDSFAGGMMGFIAAEAGKPGHGEPGKRGVPFDVVRSALAHGTVVASFNIESFSLDRLSSLTREELDRRYNEFTGMVRIR
ncbi:MAG: sugar kinase [Phycisphaeraceae bacterium]|nr:sugar kinase [Phycisphaeraceae bacterium]